MKLRGVLETSIYVDDLATAEAFYRDVLGMDVYLSEKPRHVFFKCGAQMFLLFDPDESMKKGEIPPHGARGQQHVAFRVEIDEIEEWKRRLEAKGVEIELDYRWPNGARSLYFRDPAKTSLELVTPDLWAIP